MVDVFESLTGISSGAVNIGTILIVVLLFAGLFFGVYWWASSLARYNQFKVIVWERVQNGGIVQLEDKAGIFTNRKTGNKLFYLKRLNVGLKPDNIKFVFDGKGKRVVYLLRYGFKNFSFIEPSADTLGGIRFIVGEEDVNWAINSYESNKKRFSQSLLFQILPFMVLALVCIIILILMINLFNNFDVFKDVAESIKIASENLATINGYVNTSRVVTGGVI